MGGKEHGKCKKTFYKLAHKDKSASVKSDRTMSKKLLEVGVVMEQMVRGTRKLAYDVKGPEVNRG
jgi:hypothetical protein